MYPNSKLLAEGKTKRIHSVSDLDLVRIESKDDITAGDGAKHDVFEGKAEYSTETTCNVFELLDRHDIPSAFVKRCSKTEFLARRCEMLPFEVVIRGVAMGSFLKRNPEIEKGKALNPPLVEFYLKTSGRSFNSVTLPKDDPIITEFASTYVIVYDPSKPYGAGEGILVPIEKEDRGEEQCMSLRQAKELMETTAHQVFLILAVAWRRLGFTLADLKIEFGITSDGRLVVADVIDNDSWRVLTAEGVHLDKQRYRDGEGIEKVRDLYREMADRSKMLLQY